MASLNRWQGIGNIGQDPELRYTPGGQAVCNLSVACNEKWKDKDGNPKTRTEWVRVQVWQKLAEICNQYLRKGGLVYVAGRMQTREWQDKDGNKRWTTEIVADQVLFLDSAPKDGAGRQAPPSVAGGHERPASRPAAPPTDDVSPPIPDDDIPF